MPRRRLPKPTDAELSILRVLWERGPSTVRQVQEILDRGRPTGYTTVLKLLQIMNEKRLVRRDERSKTHIYEAGVGEKEVQRRLIGELLDRAFSGSASQLVVRLLSSRRTSPRELEQIREYLDEIDGGRS